MGKWDSADTSINDISTMHAEQNFTQPRPLPIIRIKSSAPLLCPETRSAYIPPPSVFTVFDCKPNCTVLKALKWRLKIRKTCCQRMHEIFMLYIVQCFHVQGGSGDMKLHQWINHQFTCSAVRYHALQWEKYKN